MKYLFPLILFAACQVAHAAPVKIAMFNASGTTWAYRFVVGPTLVHYQTFDTGRPTMVEFDTGTTSGNLWVMLGGNLAEPYNPTVYIDLGPVADIADGRLHYVRHGYTAPTHSMTLTTYEVGSTQVRNMEYFLYGFGIVALWELGGMALRMLRSLGSAHVSGDI